MTVPIAFVHDYLTQRGGAERVVLTMTRAFPEAPLFTALYDPASTYPEYANVDVRASWLSRIRPLRERHRLALPLLAPTFSAMRPDADVLVCSSSGWAHGVGGDGARLVYCYAPARWLHQPEHYLGAHSTGGRAGRLAMAALAPPLRIWDRRAAQRATRYLVISRHSRDLVWRAYGIDAEVITPPVVIDPHAPRKPLDGIDPGFALCVSRLIVYKHVDAVVEAFGQLPDRRLVVVGDGPDAPRVRAAAPPNVSVVGSVDDETLRWCYANASVLVAAAYEDFGLTPLEANAFGVPVAALRSGGYLDTVDEHRTGVLFDEPEPDAIAAAVRSVATESFPADTLRAHAATFSEDRFVARLRAHVAEIARSAA